MSIQDPPSATPPAGRPADTDAIGEPVVRRDDTIPPADQAKLREAGETVRSDLNAAFETAKSDLQSLAETAKRDFAAVKDEALNQFQNLKGQAGGQAQSLKSQASDQIQSLKSQAEDQYQSIRGQAEGQLSEAAGKVRALASEQVGQIAGQARSFASEQKDAAARQLGGVVDAVSRVADELQASQSGTAVAGYAQNIAGSLRNVADTIQNKSVDELFSMVQDFGRRQPLAFLGIAALTGFAASRFLLASRNREVPAPRATAFDADRDFDDEVLGRQGYGQPGRTAVELDRTTGAESDRGDVSARGVGDNGRI